MSDVVLNSATAQASNAIAQPSPTFKPAMAPPEGEIANFIDPEDISSPVYASGYACTFIAFCIVALRIYTRLAIKHSFGADDGRRV